MKKATIIMLLAMVVAVALPFCAHAQVGPPGVVGPVTSGHCVSWHDPGNLQDAGSNCGGTGAPAAPVWGVGFNNNGSWGSLLPGVTGSYCLQWTSLVAAPTLASCSAGSAAFSSLTSGTNTTAAMVVGTGASLGVTGSGTITASGVPVTGVTGMGAGVQTWLITPSSANLSAAVTGSTGTGALVFGTSPSFTTPSLGAATASGLTLSSITGSTQCLQVNTSGVVSGTAAACGSGGGAVSSVSAGSSGSMSVTPTTGAVVVDLAPAANGSVLANVSGSSAAPVATSLTSFQSAMTAANAQLVTATAPTGPTNDYSPVGYGTTTAVLYLTPATGGSTINGLVAGSAMQQVFFVNAEAAGGGDNITLINQSSSDTTAANRFMASGNLVIPPGGGVDCLYLASTITRWWCH